MGGRKLAGPGPAASVLPETSLLAQARRNAIAGGRSAEDAREHAGIRQVENPFMVIDLILVERPNLS
jgi:hypothetical protein